MVIKKAEPSWETPALPPPPPDLVAPQGRELRISRQGLLQAAVQAVAHFAPVLDAEDMSQKALELAKELEKRMTEWA